MAYTGASGASPRPGQRSKRRVGVCVAAVDLVVVFNGCSGLVGRDLANAGPNGVVLIVDAYLGAVKDGDAAE